ncbi:NAD(P)H-dependent oxidoreductase [Methylocaldum sp.]|uniref:NADPH-dependent FMN reductase n=1 Tax=Methylocaldum sp. TaxID=1969727 RepID=UPI002D27A392|nr:NAD(P)H-dependent oxidoreductase [Methylocaldum sp.]HYE35970.1 NAD(P)H-dependent oxidoreductase [Methylocaldum sp.]
MEAKPKILAFAGSSRERSYNKMLVRIAAAGARRAGAEVSVVDLRDFPMPIYDGDLEDREGIPANGLKFRQLMMAHQGLLIAAPEYNSSITALLKNTIDWVSRPVGGEDGLAPFRNKVAALLAASPGGFGGLRGLVHLRAILGNIGVIVLPDQLAVAKAHEAFQPDGMLINPKQHAAVEALGANLAGILAKLHGHTLLPEPEERRHDLSRIE